MSFTIASIIVLAVGLLLVMRSVTIVPGGTTFLVERLGRYHATLGPGFHLLVPFLDSVRARVTVGERTVQVPPQACVSLDNLALRAEATLRYRVADPMRAIYEVADYERALETAAVRLLREHVGAHDASEAEAAAAGAAAELQSIVGPWGLELTAWDARVTGMPRD